MSNPSTVPVFDLKAFKESPFSLEFQAELYNADGTPTGTFFDLTGKTVRIHIAGVFQQDLDFTSAVPSTNGSSVAIVSPATDGKMTLYLSETDLGEAVKSTGTWYMQVEEAGHDETVFMRGTFSIESLETGN